MQTIAILGAGKIGRIVAHFMGNCGSYQVRVGDQSEAAVKRLESEVDAVTGHVVDFGDERTVEPVLAGAEAVLSCCPYECNPFIAKQAVKHGLHYFDLTEDIEAAQTAADLAKDSKGAMVPQCGVAPGFITIQAMNLIRKLDEVESLKLRVGALPRYPSNMLKYNLTWSTNGLINEYSNPCESLREGELRMVEPLQGYEELVLDGVRYEAFNTSGGIGSLCHSQQGKVRNLNYKTIRYPGHNDYMRLIMGELGMHAHPEVLAEIFERALPTTYQDQVVIYVSAIGKWRGRYVEHTYARTIYHQEIYGQNWSAIQITTGAGLCAVADLLLQGKLPSQGHIRQEDVDYQAFIENRFGQYYA